jgi:hypothetical protein
MPPQARQNAKNLAVKRRPSDEVVSLPVGEPANDNVPATQRGGAPVVQNPTAVSAETGRTLPKNISESLQNQALVRREEPPSAREEEQQFRENQREQDSLVRRLPQIQATPDEGEQDESEGKSEEKTMPPFPLIAFALCVAEWMITLTLAILFFVISVILLPLGVVLEVILEAWKISVGVALWFWIAAYEHKHLRSVKNDTKNAIKLARLLKSPRAKRAMLLGINAIPVVGNLLPVNAYMVYSTYSSVKKQIKKANLAIKK